MAKFSILRDEEEDEEEFCIQRPKRRRTYIPQSSSTAPSRSIDRHTFQQQQQRFSEEEDDDDEIDSEVGPTKAGGSISVILSDPDVLDCSICFNPLTIPVFQCDNGHIACSSCCNSLGNKCPSCCGKIGNNRCRAIEKVIEAVRVSCCYLRYGCRETISYCEKHEHEEKCMFAPCACPFPNCLFRGSHRKLSTHISKEHADLLTRFRYNSVFSVSLGMDEKVLVLQEESDGVLFILSHGNTIAVRCINPSLLKRRFAYDLVLRSTNTSLKFQSFTHCNSDTFSDPLSEDYVLIPGYFYHNDGRVNMEICIWSKDASHALIT